MGTAMKESKTHNADGTPKRFPYPSEPGYKRMRVRRNGHWRLESEEPEPGSVAYVDRQRLGYAWNEARAPMGDACQYEGTNYGGAKETIERHEVVLKRDASRTILDVRLYMARRARGASPVYATVWYCGKGEQSGSGSGTAFGYGYDKRSSAIEEAFTEAGFSFRASFGGCGDGAVRVALVAAARALGFRGDLVIL